MIEGGSLKLSQYLSNRSRDYADNSLSREILALLRKLEQSG